MEPLLSILIPSLECRKDYFDDLLDLLYDQIEMEKLQDTVEVRTLVSNGEFSIGTARNRLLAKATGDYVCFCDDDDEISPLYLYKLVEALISEEDIDAVGFKIEAWIDSQFIDTWSIRARPTIQERQSSVTGISHLLPIWRDIAQTFTFPDANGGEDIAYSNAIRPLIKKEIFLPDVLYYYYKRTDKTGELNNNAKREADRILAAINAGETVNV